MINDGRNLKEGMSVYSSDNHKVGKIVRLAGSGFEVEKGFFFPKDYAVSFGDVTRISGDEVYLSLTKDQLQQGWERATTTSTAFDRSVDRTDTSVARRGAVSTTSETRVPVVEEELDVTKRSREAGAVRITKDVKTEVKNIEVPVTREEVRVERVPVDSPRAAREGEGAFQSGEVVVPVREEEVEIRKRPVVKEEVRVTKDARTEEERVSEKVRREEVRVDEDIDETRRTYRDDEPGLHAADSRRDDDKTII